MTACDHSIVGGACGCGFDLWVGAGTWGLLEVLFVSLKFSSTHD